MIRALVVGLVVAGPLVCGSGTPVALSRQAAVVPAAPVAAPPIPVEREQRLRTRVAQWHDARIARDQRAMYDLLEPDYRAKVDFATYSRETTLRLRFSLVKYEIAAIEPVAEDRAMVRVDLRMDLGRFGENVVPATDAWVWRDGDWWLVFKEIELPFPK